MFSSQVRRYNKFTAISYRFVFVDFTALPHMLPYENEIGTTTDRHQMTILVAENNVRPGFSESNWTCSSSFLQSCKRLMACCWDIEPEARLTSNSLRNLIQKQSPPDNTDILAYRNAVL